MTLLKEALAGASVLTPVSALAVVVGFKAALLEEDYPHPEVDAFIDRVNELGNEFIRALADNDLL